MKTPSRFPSSFQSNLLAEAVARARSDGRGFIDLTLANPTRAGFDYPLDVLAPLASAHALIYEPEPLGLASARDAVASDYRRRGFSVNPERIVLTASTSEAYAWLFKLLCAPAGDDVLVPTPSYPLFDHLTRLEGVRPVPYCLEYHGRWAIEPGSIEEAWSERARAVLVVSPNNPTGSSLDAAELRQLGEHCARHGAAMIVDEVFADYPLGADAATVALAMPPECLTIRLGGLSKSAGLPQVKLGWMALDGPEEMVARAMARLELIADTYLSVATPVQIAAPLLIAAGASIRSQILDRVRRNYQALQTAVRLAPSIEVLRADAGWSAVLRAPATRSEEALALELLEHDDVLVHPGYFFDFAREAFLVVSLLCEPAAFDEGLGRLLARASA